MSKDLDHAQTHRVCQNRLTKEKGEARCCDCVPHENCGDAEKLDAPVDFVEEAYLTFLKDTHGLPLWVKDYNDSWYQLHPKFIQNVLNKVLSRHKYIIREKVKKEMVGLFEGMKIRDGVKRMEKTDNEMNQLAYILGFNTAIEDIISLIKE